MTIIKIDMTRYFELVEKEKEYLGQSGYSRRYLEDFAKEKKEEYQELLNYDTILRSEIYFRNKQDYIDLIQNYLENKPQLQELAFRIKII